MSPEIRPKSFGTFEKQAPGPRTQSTGRSFIHVAVKMWNGMAKNIVGKIDDKGAQSFKTHEQVPFTITDNIRSHGVFVYNLSKAVQTRLGH